jgi:endonuclease/exonuclease/phosphatase family metal-dependent hydrolase
MARFRLTLRVLIVLLLTLLAPLALFAVNGLLLARGETPFTRTTSHPAAAPAGETAPVEVKVVAYNIAKGFAHKGGISFEDREVVAARMRRVAEVIDAEKPDLVFLSEVVFECTPCPVNQAEVLAEATGMHAYACGENYNIGLPFYRVVGGNAILSRWPLEAVANPSLAGRKPFYLTKNSRRVLWAAAQVGGRRVLLASIHNDSFNPENNLAQMRQILDYAGSQEALLAGDFNAKPHWPSIKIIKESGAFSGAFQGPNTFPSDRPDRRIDFIFAPKSWEPVDERVIGNDASDHLAVVATFRVRP